MISLTYILLFLRVTGLEFVDHIHLHEFDLVCFSLQGTFLLTRIIAAPLAMEIELMNLVMGYIIYIQYMNSYVE